MEGLETACSDAQMHTFCFLYQLTYYQLTLAASTAGGTKLCRMPDSRWCAIDGAITLLGYAGARELDRRSTTSGSVTAKRT